MFLTVSLLSNLSLSLSLSLFLSLSLSLFLSVQASNQLADKWTNGDEQHFPLGLSWKRLPEPPLSIPIVG